MSDGDEKEPSGKGFTTSEHARRLAEIDALRGRPITRLAFDRRLSAEEMEMLRAFRKASGGNSTFHKK